MLYWVISLESDYVFHLTLFTFTTPHMHTRKCIANSSEVATRGTHVKCTSVPITFHRTLQAFTSTVPNMTGKSLDHPYIARVELTHGTPLPVRKCWEEAVQELAVVGLVPPGPEHEVANDPLSPTTRFLQCLEEDLFPFHFDFTQDSDRNYLHPHSPSQTIAHTL